MKRSFIIIAGGILITALVGGFGHTDENTDESPEGVEVLGVKITEPFIYDSHGRRDPFVPLIIPSEVPTPTPVQVPIVPDGLTAINDMATPTPTPVLFPGLEIDCILWFPERPSLAVINNALLHVGDVIDECEVVAIDRDSVTMRFMGAEQVFTTNGSH